jgi:hypothetical protein
MGCNDRKETENLRKRIWYQLSGKAFDGGSMRKKELVDIFEKWVELRNNNREKKMLNLSMTGFLLPVEDNRSSTIRLG